MKNMKKQKERLRYWKEKAEQSEREYQAQLDRMDERERIYRGIRTIRALDGRGLTATGRHQTPHVRNLAAELIEAQVDTGLPHPKVTPRRKQDEHLAEIIEGMLRDELDRLPFERINDQAERTTPIQGGSLYLVEWDHTAGSQTESGEVNVMQLHPKQVIPQEGVAEIEDMDYIVLKLPQTKSAIQRRYGIDVEEEPEEEPGARGVGSVSPANSLVTQYTVYYRNDHGGIGRYSWVGDTELEYLEDYQARRLRRCRKCGAPEPTEDVEPIQPPFDSEEAEGTNPALPERRKGTCPYCGADSWETREEEFEEIWEPIYRRDGSVIPGATGRSVVHQQEIADGKQIPAWIELQQEPTRIPYYKPDLYPVVLQKNVSIFGQFLGESDVDKIEDHQLTTNRIEKKIIDKLSQGGSYITLPTDSLVKADGEDMRIIRPRNQADKAMIDVYNLQAEIGQDMNYLAQVYDEARQAIGITDSYQGRRDTTATSGTAKEFAARQTAGRLESKRIMREAAYSRMFELIFKLKLAYADEPRPVAMQDQNGDTIFEEFNRYDFLERDETGQWYWNDQFLFSCDTSAPLASNREAMWQETRQNLQTGAFGDPTDLNSLILFWARMEQLHYPGAAATKKNMEQQLKQQRQQQLMMAQVQMQSQLARQNAAREQTEMQSGQQALSAVPNQTKEMGVNGT